MLAEREFTGSDITRQVATATRAWRAAIVELLEPGPRRRPVSADIDVDALADHLYTTFEGAYILCRTFEDRSRCAPSSRCCGSSWRCCCGGGPDGWSLGDSNP